MRVLCIMLSNCYSSVYSMVYWYVITWHLILDIWHRHLTCYTWHLISDTDTWHVILDTWYLTLVLAMLYLTLDSWHAITWYWHTWLDIVTPDRILLHLTPVFLCIFMIITFTGTWHDYYIISRHLVFLNSCALNSCILKPQKKGDSWYYIPVDPRNWITMNKGLLWILCGHCHQTNYNN